MGEDVRDNLDSPTNPVKVIRVKCLDCCNGSYTEVDNCTVKRCPLHPFRFGKNPYRTKRELSDEQKGEMAERLKNARQQKHQQP